MCLLQLAAHAHVAGSISRSIMWLPCCSSHELQVEGINGLSLNFTVMLPRNCGQGSRGGTYCDS